MRGAVLLADRVHPRAVVRAAGRAARRGWPDTSGASSRRRRATWPARRSSGRRSSGCRAIAALPRGRTLHQVVEALFDLRPFVDAGAVQRDDAGGRARKQALSALHHVHEAAVGVLAALDVVDAAVDRLVGHEQAGVPRGPQGHHLADGDRDVGVAPLRLIAPAALVVLRVDDQVARPWPASRGCRAASSCRSTRPGTAWRSRGRTSARGWWRRAR